MIPHPKLRSIYFRLLGATIGNNVRIEKVILIQAQNTISNLMCGNNIFIGTGVVLDLSAKIILDDYSVIGPGCSILTHQNFGEFHGNIISSIYKTKYNDVHLKKNAIIGADSTILAGSCIGENSVVGAKSLVTDDVPPNVLVAGIPAKIIRHHSTLIPVIKE